MGAFENLQELNDMSYTNEEVIKAKTLSKVIETIKGMKKINEVHLGTNDKWADISLYNLISKSALLSKLKKI